MKRDAARAAAARRAPAPVPGLRGSPGTPPLVRNLAPRAARSLTTPKKHPVIEPGRGRGEIGNQASRASAETWGSSAAAGAATAGGAAATSGSSSSAGGGGT